MNTIQRIGKSQSVHGVLLSSLTLFVSTVGQSCRNVSSTTTQSRPVVERASIHYMMPAAEAAHDAVVSAEVSLLEDPPNVAAARKSLDKARQSLANLQWFYVPATEARENLYNAYMEDLAGHPEERDTYLDTARRQLLEISGQSASSVESYIRDIADRIETVQLHIRDGVMIDDELRSLCDMFQLHLLKAQLVLDENAFGTQENNDSTVSREVDNVNQK